MPTAIAYARGTAGQHSTVSHEFAVEVSEYLVRGGRVITPAGDWTPERVVVVEFPSRVRLWECLASADYRRIAPLWEQSTTGKAIVVEGC